MNPDPIAEMASLLEKATPGEWRIYLHPDHPRVDQPHHFVVVGDDPKTAPMVAHINGCNPNQDADGRLIVAMQRNFQALLMIAKAARKFAPQLRMAEGLLYKRWCADDSDITHKAWVDAQKVAIDLEQALAALAGGGEGMTFFRQQFFPVAVCALLMQHKDGLAWGIVNLAIAALVVLAISGVLHLVRKP